MAELCRQVDGLPLVIELAAGGARPAASGRSSGAATRCAAIPRGIVRRSRAWYEQSVAMADARWITDRSRTCMSTAGSLAVSQCTVESRVEHILTGLGVTSRAQIAAWITMPDPADEG